MNETLDSYVRKRAQDLNINLVELADLAKVSRQSVYALAEVPRKLPSLKTIISIAGALHIHPIRLLTLIFDQTATHPAARPSKRGDRTAFVADVTFPDGTLVLPNQIFTKTWELQNSGKVAWENRYLKCMDEEITVHANTGEALVLAENLIPHAKRVPIPFTKPGESVRISVDFTAPKLQMTVLSYWKSVFEDDSFCFPKAKGLWCKVRVNFLAGEAAEDR